MTVLGRLKNGNLMITGEVNERLPVIINGLVAHYPLDGTVQKYIPSKIRYIRDWLNGSTSNASNHWVEIQAIDYDGVNVALSKGGTSIDATWNTVLTDGVTTTSPYWGTTTTPFWVQVDLGDLFNIDLIKVWHYYNDGRTYHNTKTEVSGDGVTWYTIFDSSVEGEYQETSRGKTHYMNSLGITANPGWHPVTWQNATGVTVGTDNSLTKTAGTGAWDSGAISSEKFSGDVSLQWKVKYVDGVTGAEMLGFNSNHTTFSYTDIDYAIDTNGSFYVFENGTNIGSFGTCNADTDTFKIEIKNTTVRYYRNDILFYTSLVFATFPVYVDTSMHCYGLQNSIADVNVCTNINTTINNDGISIEEPTTNLINNGDFSSGLTGWDLSGGKGNATIYTTTLNDGKTCLYQDVGIWIQTDYRYYTLTLIANTTYTISFLIYRVSGVVIFDPNGPWDTNYNLTPEIGKWVKHSYTFTTGATGGSEYFYFYADANRAKYYLTDVQLEQKPYTTSFTKSIRYSSSLDLPSNILSYSQGTIVFRMASIIGWKNSTINNGTAEPYVDNYFTWGVPGQANCMWGRFIRSTQIFYFYYALGSVSYSYASDPNFNDNNENHFAMSWTSGVLKLYVNGVNVSSSTGLTFSTPTNSCIELGRRHGYASASSKFSNFTSYNRALSDDEVSKLYKSSFTITKEGDLKGIVVEKPIMPNGTYHFPLVYDGYNVNGSIPSSSTSNEYYSDYSAWVGSSTTNIITDGACNISYPKLNNNFLWSTWFDTSQFGCFYGRCAAKFKGTTSSWGGVVILGDWSTLNGLVVGSTYTGSMMVYIPSSTYSRSESVLQIGNDTTGWSFSSYVQYDKWVRYSVTYTVPAGAPWVQFRCVCGSSNIDSNAELYITDVQLEQLPFPTPFALTTRPATKLQYNLNSSIGLDWNGDWSIIYWVMPVGTSTGTLTGYNLSSLGCNGNTVGGGYIWWGKTSGSDAIYSSTPSTITPSTYFNIWHMVSLVKSSTNLVIREYINGQIYIRTTSFGTIPSNYFVTQHGYDLMLGGWDNINVSNSYFKDLFVVKRALSDTELNNITNCQMRAKKNNLLISEKIIEKALL